MTLTPFDAIEEMFGDDMPCCEVCSEVIADECYFIDPGYLCLTCFVELETETETEAKLFASQNLRITKPFPNFDPLKTWTITPQEYADGNRESNTENAYRTRCRHECTNYDDLLASLSKQSEIHQIYYKAIREAVDKLVNDEIESKDLIV